MKRKESDSVVNSQTEKQIGFMLKERKRLYQDKKQDISKQESILQQKQLAAIDKHVAQYSKVAGLMKIINSSQKLSKNNDYSKFWNQNQDIQREVQDRLRQLKEMDQRIDDVLNEQYELCNQTEEIQEDIRRILIRKEPNYMSQAEPLLTKKTKNIDELHTLKQQKQSSKDKKLSIIKELLKLLEKLREHRQQRLSYCSEQRVSKESMELLIYLIKDFKQLTQKQQNVAHNESTFRKLEASLESNEQRIGRLQQQLMGLFGQQNRILQAMKTIKKEKEEFSYLQQKLYDKLGMQSKDLPLFLERSVAAIDQEQEKKQESEQLVQGIATTNQTLKIFKHIQESIETENRRKQQLLKTLSLLQKEYQQQTLTQEKIADIEGQIQKLDLKKQRLLKKLSSKADQADVNAYKSLNNQLQDLETQSRARKVIIKDMKEQLSEKARQLYLATSSINEEFKDILTQVVPQVWFRDHDFSKEETIKDLNLYLVKTFNRLNAKE